MLLPRRMQLKLAEERSLMEKKNAQNTVAKPITEVNIDSFFSLCYCVMSFFNVQCVLFDSYKTSYLYISGYLLMGSALVR